MTSVDPRPIIDQIPQGDLIHQESLSVLPLIHDLCNELAIENIAYCHWKSNDVLERSASGDNDLDLLVSRTDITKFSEILYRLGFKGAKAPQEKKMPGVLDFFGYDGEVDKIIHVHAHYQLILGHDMTKNYRLPIEKPYLESAVQSDLFKIPALEFEYIVFVIRMTIKHSTWDTILGRQGKLKPAERRELAFLTTRINQERVYELLNRFLPYIDDDLFNNCVQALQPTGSPWTRIKTGHQLQIRLQVYARRSLFADTFLKLWRRVIYVIRRRVYNSSSKYQLNSGGAMIAIVGGDGAGKSTAVAGLHSWLSNNFQTTIVHMGKPAWSSTTITIRGILKIGKLLGLFQWGPFNETQNQKSLVSPEYPWLLREVCRARDRYWTYRRAQRYAVNGGLVILDRYPLPQIKIMDGPQAERFIKPHQDNRLTKGLVELEGRYYRQIVLPELIIVLRLNPEIAVHRKTDEDANTVRERSTEIWEIDWMNSGAFIIEASKTKTEVLNELKVLIWSQL